MVARVDAASHDSAVPPLRVGVSSCLLGARVRFDGGDKRNPFLADGLGRYVEWVPVCPEVEVGMGVPREPVRLMGDPRAPRMLGIASGIDHSDAMRRYARARVRALAALGLSGYVLKRGSPSCGIDDVPVYGRRRAGTRPGRGLFAAALLAAYPALPVEEEGRLEDAAVRDHFIERIFCYRRWRVLLRRPRYDALVAFHAAHALLVQAHSVRGYAALDRLVVERAYRRPAALVRAYGARFMAVLAVPSTVANHARVLERVARLCRPCLDGRERRELASVIERYRRGRVSLLAPITRLRDHVERHAVAAARDQVYLRPHPHEVMLRYRL